MLLFCYHEPTNDTINFEHKTVDRFGLSLFQVDPFCTDDSTYFDTGGQWEEAYFIPSCPLPVEGEARSLDIFIVNGWAISLNMGTFEEIWPEWFTGMTVIATEPQGVSATENLFEHSGPNPFRGLTRFNLELVEPAMVRVAVYDLLGHEVAVLADTRLPAGRSDLRWEPRGLPGGTYLVRLTTGTGASAVRPVTFLR